MRRETSRREPTGRRQKQQLELRSVASLPTRAKLITLGLCLAVIGFLVWLTIHLLTTESLPVAIILLVLSYIGFTALLVALLTVTRAIFNLRSLPFLLGRFIYRLLTKG